MKYREAMQFWPNKKPWPEGVTEYVVGGEVSYYLKTGIRTLNITPGDWIITGLKGERYSCKADIFVK